MSKKPETKREWALERAELSCEAGREGLHKEGDTLLGNSRALYALLHAVEDIAEAMREEEE